MTKPFNGSQKPQRKPSRWSKYWFHIVLILLAVIGVLSAFFVPTLIPGLKDDGNTVVSVRQSILAVLAGALTMLTLSETHRKNTHEKDKNDRDHTRQVYAERRSRYTKAVEQLANEKAAVRLGGIYTLVGLVDEWITDDSLDPDEQQKEGQVIINNLCSYLRSLPSKTKLSDLKKGKYPSDEAEVRIAIVKEISARINFNSNPQWSDFKYDLSNIFFFYPVNFSKCVFKHPALFNDSYFAEGASFNGVNFNNATNFSGATFRKKADFSNSYFKLESGEAICNALNNQDYSLIANDFSRTVFTKGAKANFSHGEVHGEITFREAEFKEGIYLSQKVFFSSTSFIGAKFEKSTNFYATFVNSAPEFVMKYNNGKEYKAKFSIGAFVNDYKMETNPDGKSFPLEDHTLSNTGTFTIPKGCRLFDPKNPSKQLNVTIKPHQ